MRITVFDDLGRERRTPACASGCRRCSRARRCRRAPRTPRCANASRPSRSARSIVHAFDSGACTRHRSSTSLQLVGAARADADGRAPLGEPFGERGADARRRAGHQHVLAVQVVRSCSDACGQRSLRARMPITPAIRAAHRPARRSSPAPRPGIGAAVATACARVRRRPRAVRPRRRRPRHGPRAEIEAAGRDGHDRRCSTSATATPCGRGSRPSRPSTCSSTTRAAVSTPTSST